MILEGMTLSEVRKQLLLEKRDVDKLRKKVASLLKKERGKVAVYMTGVSNRNNLWVCGASEIKGKPSTVAICVAPLVGRSDDYIMIVNDCVVVFTAHALKRLKERVGVMDSEDYDEVDRKVKNAMILMSLFGANEAYPTMSANVHLMRQMDLDSLNTAHSGRKMYQLVRTHLCTLVVEVVDDGGYIVRTIIADEMIADEKSKERFKKSNQVVMVVSAAHILLNPDMYNGDVVSDCERQVDKAVRDGLNPVMFAFTCLPRARRDNDIITFRLGDLRKGKRAKSRKTVNELLDFVKDRLTFDVFKKKKNNDNRREI